MAKPRIAIGTCGYSYKDWVGPVYPPKTKPGEMLDLYAERFAAVEIDATYYRVPGIVTFESMAAHARRLSLRSEAPKSGYASAGTWNPQRTR
jgi:uncharacterized protein YecE (DUF72 family)